MEKLPSSINNNLIQGKYNQTDEEDQKISKVLTIANLIPKSKILTTLYSKIIQKSLSIPKIRIVCISDTHNYHSDLIIPKGDILIHAGDFTENGSNFEFKNFNNWLGQLKGFSHKIVIGGNHDPILYSKLLTNCIYLHNKQICLFGYKIYGSAYKKIEKKFRDYIGSDIPSDVDILITHVPPYGYCDRIINGKSVGSKSLALNVVNRIKPIIHIFGHIHEGYGGDCVENTIFLNAAILNQDARPYNLPIIFDLPCK